MKQTNWRVVEVSRNIHEVRFEGCRAGHVSTALLNTDAHWDNPHCDRSLLRKHFNEAKAAGAPIFIAGDFFCAMQGKWDKRGNKDSIRPEHSGANYLNRLVKTAAEWLEPYAENLAVIGYGNHETAITKHHEFDLVEELVDRIRTRNPKSQVRAGGFSGWVRFRFIRGVWQGSKTLWYHHGYGGGGPVTRGVIQSNRRAVYAEADVIWTGHTHDAWDLPIPRISLTQGNVMKHSNQLHVSTPGYKEEFGDGSGGYHIEGGRPPKPLGGYWLSFRLSESGLALDGHRTSCPDLRIKSEPRAA